MMMLIKLLSFTVFILEYFLSTEAQLCSEGELSNNQTNCCKGYRLEGGKCIVCSSFKFGDNCASTCSCVQANSESCSNVDGTCRCKPGYTGSNCQSACSIFKFGKNCSSTCKCVQANSESCSNVDGTCRCKPGYTGSNCQSACSIFKFGKNCSSTCSCVQANSQSCNNVNGMCMCKPGYMGTNCESRCASWTFGNGCKQCTCERDKTSDCNFVSGVCTCFAGYKGTDCKENCDDNTYGIKCASQCTCNAVNSASPCNKVNGTCNCRLGYDPRQNCGKECRLPHYGESCLLPCKCNTRTASSCNAFTGECVCRPGYAPPGCREVCSGYTYGQNCSTNCTCVPENTRECHPVTGGCTCLAGWRGQNCQLECEDGTYGDECAKECNCQGNQFKTCRKSDGLCICSTGYGGENCSKPCAMWRYGSECLGRCECHVNNSISCDTITGVCTCKSGYISEFCEGAIYMAPERSSVVVEAAVGSVVALLFIASAVGIGLFVMMSRRKRRYGEVAKADTNGLTVTNQTYNNTEFNQNEAEEPTYENMATAKTQPSETPSSGNAYDTAEKTKTDAALYGNVEVSNPALPPANVGGEYESVTLTSGQGEGGLYEALRKQSSTDTSLYTGLHFDNKEEKGAKKSLSKKTQNKKKPAKLPKPSGSQSSSE